MIKLEKTCDSSHYDSVTKVEFNIDDNGLGLTEILRQVELFIRAIGYNPKGELDFIEEEE